MVTSSNKFSFFLGCPGVGLGAPGVSRVTDVVVVLLSSLQVPVVAVLGSVGGFRAVVGFAGVMKALFESGVLDCATYIAGLSGSTW